MQHNHLHQKMYFAMGGEHSPHTKNPNDKPETMCASKCIVPSNAM